MFRATGQPSYLATAHNITAAVIRNLTTADGVLVEPCDRDDTCDLDADIFKGIFMKNLRYLLDADPSAPAATTYRKFVARNIAAVKGNAMCEPGINGSVCHIVYLGTWDTIQSIVLYFQNDITHLAMEYTVQCTLNRGTKEEETDRREGKGRRCCLADVLKSHTIASKTARMN